MLCVFGILYLCEASSRKLHICHRNLIQSCLLSKTKKVVNLITPWLYHFLSQRLFRINPTQVRKPTFYPQVKTRLTTRLVMQQNYSTDINVYT